MNQIESDIRRIYFESKGCYGSPWITEELKSEGIRGSRKTVAKHMKLIGLKSKLSSKYRITTDSSHKEPVAENILNREFTVSAPG